MDDPGQEEVVAFLSDPASHGAPGPVEVITTHVSIVFLVGTRAYKLKRAVTLPYLDFSTAEARRRACEAELALNRRIAPDLYLGVRSVNRGTDGRLGFGAGKPVDWLVVMRRFDQEALLDRIAARGELTPQLLRLLADCIAEFHEAAEIHRDCGGASAVRAVIDGNRRSMAEAADLPDARIAELHCASLAAARRLAPLLDRRRQSGRVRLCHGDLHLRNICLIDDRPVPFDCIEFSRTLACIDVLYDLAFLLMDLWQRGLAAEAGFVLNRYLDRSDQADGLPALPLFLSMRAAVRAHVAAATGDGDAARAYLNLAVDLLRPRPARLVAIGGLSGTGKSTLAYGLAPDIGPPPGGRVLRSDVLRKRLLGVAPEVALAESAYASDVTAEVYRQLAAEAGTLLAAGHGVIADAVFARPGERAGIAAVAAAAGIPFAGLWLDAPAADCEQRVAARLADASDATVAVVRRQRGYDLGPLRGWQRIDASAGAGAVLGVARSLLD